MQLNGLKLVRVVDESEHDSSVIERSILKYLYD
jgi:hypothetical protein